MIEPASLGLALLAGALSTLSPCVLPLLPIVVAAAAQAHRRAAWALAAGLALAYAAAGTLLARAGRALEVDATTWRTGAAVLLALLGAVLLLPVLQRAFARATAGAGHAGHALLARLQPRGLGGAFTTGLLLGLVWVPCVGPTLGAALVLASRGGAWAPAAAVMLAFGVGAALPLLAVGHLTQAGWQRWRGRLQQGGHVARALLGAALLLLALAVLTGADKAIEAWLVAASPDWLTRLTTRF